MNIPVTLGKEDVVSLIVMFAISLGLLTAAALHLSWDYDYNWGRGRIPEIITDWVIVAFCGLCALFFLTEIVLRFVKLTF